jgi:hypothetical protein
LRQGALQRGRGANVHLRLPLPKLPKRDRERHSPVVGVPQPALSVQGELKTYVDKGDSGQAQFRRFCPECGSSILDEAAAFPGVLFILAGTLDDPSWVKPGMQIFCDSAQSWVQLGGDMQLFPRMPG